MDWKQILRKNFTNWTALADFLELNEEQKRSILPNPRFVLNLPLRLAQKIQKNTLDDPILKQFLPTVQEKAHALGFVTDPVGDSGCRQSSKLLHKYRGRVLLVCTSACAMHCRYCFRQHFDYEVREKAFEEELSYVRTDPTIKEVILSGGDPLSLPSSRLESLLKKIGSISHVKRIRFHTRFPIGIPERIDVAFLHMIDQLRQQVWFVIHCNHPAELDDDVMNRLHELQKRRVTVANQAVLLKGVNDDVDTLQQLSERLVDHGMIPYYLHQLDKVQGASHFEVEEKTGVRLIEELSERLPGYAVPKYVREIAGKPCKTSIL